MFKKVTLVLFLCALIALPGFARTVKKVDLPESYLLGKDNLVINGAGARVKTFLGDVYVCALYKKAKSNNADAIVNADEPMVFKIVLTSSMINQKRFTEALNEGFTASTGGNMGPYMNEINTFKGFFAIDMKPGDRFDMEYVPNVGVTTKITKKGETTSRTAGTIKGLAFKKILFGIWLGQKPMQADLKAALIGG